MRLSWLCSTPIDAVSNHEREGGKERSVMVDCKRIQHFKFLIPY